MRKYLKKWKHKARAGSTLVEMMVTLLVFGILMSMVVAVLHPAAKIFIRMQKFQYAQVILDNTIQELRGIALEASGNGYVKIYRECELTATGNFTDLTSDSPNGNGIGDDKGRALEFINLDDYVLLLSVDGSPSTKIYMGTTEIGEEERIEAGRLLTRYYARESGNTYYLRENIGGTGIAYVARAVAPVFADGHQKDGSTGPLSGYYMGNYLGLEFSFPDEYKEETDAGEVLHRYYSYVNVKVSLYSDPERKPEHLVVEDTASLDFRYPIERLDAVTAKERTTSAG